MSYSESYDPNQGVAVIGFSGRFPGAPSVDDLWRNVKAGVSAISRFDPGELDPAAPEEQAARRDPAYVPVRGILEAPELFDAEFFGINPKEAEVLDPQQRVFLEVAWHALEHAGVDPARARAAIGVFAGMTNNSYFLQNLFRNPRHENVVGGLITMMGNEKDYLATRLSYELNLLGPSLNIQTACSTSLVAVCQAVSSLESYQCDVALAGGVSITFPQRRGYLYEEGSILSPDGVCRPFDAEANGTVFSHGAGVVILKRLADAIADRDTIWAVIKGAALNNDGSGKVSFTAPSVDGQAQVIAAAQALAGIDPDTIGYVEAHGTGTALGDPIELAALTQAFRLGTHRTGYCAIGSLKSAIGHLDAAAGVAGLIKAVRAVHEGTLPPSLNFRTPNPKLELERSPFFVNTETRPWVGSPRRAGVSSFGVGGTNAHVVLEEAPRREPSPARGPEVLVLSARSSEALEAATRGLETELQQGASLPDLAWTLQQGRARFDHRRVLVAKDGAQALEELGRRDPRRVPTDSAERWPETPILFAFPGQGAQHPGMGRALYEHEPIFRAEVDACAEVLAPLLGRDLRELLYPQDPTSEDAARAIRETAMAQPALFVVEHALVSLLGSVGLEPAMLVGHSVGEYAAAVRAGVMDRDDALRLLAHRARLMQALPPGAMLAVRLPAAELELGPELSVAAINGPQLTVVSGPHAAVDALAAQLAAREVSSRPLHTSHAFHSAMMEPMVEPFLALAAEISLRAPDRPWVSTSTGDWVTPELVTDPRYWAEQVRRPVLFADAVARLLTERRVILEVGPGDTLSQLFLQHPEKALARAVIPTLPRDDDGGFHRALGRAWMAGLEPDWVAVHGGLPRYRVPAPGYPFQRKRFFVEPSWEARPERPASVEPAEPAAVLPAPEPTVAEATAPEPTAPAGPPEDEFLRRLTTLFSELSGLPAESLAPGVPFLELGLDSLFLTQASTAIQRRLGVKVGFGQLLEELVTLDRLAAHVAERAPAPGTRTQKAPVATAAAHPPAPRKVEAFGPYRPPSTTVSAELPPAVRAHLDEFIPRYNARTRGSKASTEANRPVLADPRSVSGFRALTKELVYPIVVERSRGARLWDVDGNEYVDLTNGFGMIMFGHGPEFVLEAVRAQLDRGMEIGPQTPLAGEVARTFSRMTGMERVAFCNTGSEAVTAAIRVARTVSGRDPIVFFTGDYHGIFDEVLARPTVVNGARRAAPIAPGIPDAMLENVVVLEYGAPESMDWIREHADELAAVLVEPVQSRRPEFQPVEFLRELRAVTAASEVALVFDEVVTGFRTHPGGLQARWGIRADLATYGKVVGGGLPIGVVAGSARYMDALDGGAWSYGDASVPSVGMTFFAGTFVRHPLALAAARAVLDHLEAAGPALQETLERRTQTLVGRLSHESDRVGAQVRISTFSSWFLIQTPPEFPHAPLLFPHLRERGLHIWEGRPTFLTTAHTDADLEHVVNAFRDSLAELQRATILPRLPEPASLPLTLVQEELSLALQLGDDAVSASYNQCFPLRLRGRLSMDALRVALERLTLRHAGLRAVFAPDGQTQTIQAPRTPEVPELDLQGAPERLSELIRDESREPFDLAHGPLWRARVARLGPEESVLILTAHHLVCDGWSSSVLLKDLGALYAQAAGTGPGPSWSAAAYEAYVRARHAPAEQVQQQADLSYWQTQHRGGVAPLELPVDRPRPRTRTHRGGREAVALDANLYAELKRLGARSGATLYATLLAGFEALLHRLTGQTDFVVGIPIAGQAALENGDLVAHCVHTLPLRAELSPDEPFTQHLSRARSGLVRAQEHQSVSFGRLLGAVDVERVAGRLPLVQATFNVDKLGPPPNLGELRTELLASERSFVNFELEVNVVDSGRDALVECSYDGDLFDGATIVRWLNHYLVLLAGVVAAPETPLGRLPLLSSEERLQLLHAWNDRATFPHAPRVHDAFARRAAERPDAPAVRLGDEVMSYGELERRANQVAHRLRDEGVGPGTLVGLCAERSPGLVVALLGILKAGGAYVPLDPSYPHERLRFMAEDAGLSLILSAGVPTPPEFPGARVVAVDRLTGPSEPVPPRGDADDLAYVIYTSGSTGLPKGVRVTHRQVARLFQATEAWFGFGPKDVIPLFHSYAFDFSVWEVWSALAYGGRLELVPYLVSRDPEVFCQFLAETGVTVLNQTPSAFRPLVEADARRPPALALRTIVFGGEALELEALRPWIARHGDSAPELVNMYGITETTVHVTHRRIRAHDLDHAEASVIGRPIPDLQLYVLDPSGEPAPLGVPGEIYVGGAGVASGYLNRPELTAARFLPDPFTPGGALYRSGDLARRLPGGELVFVGRADQQVKVRGHRIELGEVQAALERLPGVRQAVVRLDGDLVAYVVGTGTLTARELREGLRQTLPEPMIPSAFLLLDRLPLTPQGKLDVRALPAIETAPREGALAPRTPTEQAVHEAWASALGRAGLGVDENFFEVGGHSTIAARILTGLRARFQIELPLRTLFERPTVAGIAEAIDAIVWAKQAPRPPSPSAPREEFEL